MASANLRIIERENLVTRVREELAPHLAAKWRQLAEHPLVGEARCTGLIGAVELVRDKSRRRFFDKRGEVGTICRDFCFDNGLIMRAVRDTMIVSPPLVITPAQLDELAEKAWRCLDLALARPLLHQEQPQERGLAGAARAGQEDELTLPDGQRQVAQRVDAAVVLFREVLRLDHDE